MGVVSGIRGAIGQNWPQGLSQRSFAVVALVAGLALAACKSEPQPPMRIGMHVWPGFEPLFLARHEGLLSEKDFRLVEFSDGSEVGRAFRNGELDAVCLTLDEAFYLVQNGADPVILLVLDESNGADVVMGRAGIAALGDLRGRRVAVEVSAVETYMLTRALQHAGMSAQDVKPVYLPPEKHVEAFTAGKVDAVVTYEPTRTKLMEAGAVVLFSSAQIPGEIVDVLVVRRNYLEGHPGRMRALRAAWFAALARMRRAPEASAEIMGVREQMTGKEFAAALSRLDFPDAAKNRALLEGDPPGLLKTAERLKAVMREAGLLQQDIPLKPLFPPPESTSPP
jgi:NitT/TauT family transport system substrate-binding protein